MYVCKKENLEKTDEKSIKGEKEEEEEEEEEKENEKKKKKRKGKRKGGNILRGLLSSSVGAE